MWNVGLNGETLSIMASTLPSIVNLRYSYFEKILLCLLLLPYFCLALNSFFPIVFNIELSFCRTLILDGNVVTEENWHELITDESP